MMLRQRINQALVSTGQLTGQLTALLMLTTLSLIACDAEEQGALAGGSRAGGADGGQRAGGEGAGAPAGGMGGEAGGLTSGTEAGLDSGVEAGFGGGGEPQGCSLDGVLSQDLLPELRTTQIHPDAAWDGEAFWVTWTLPNEESKFEVWAGRFGCDLSPLVAPFPLAQVSGMNDTDSVVAVSGEQVMVAWMRDNGFADGATYNLSTLTQALDRQTGERLGEPQTVRLSVENEVRAGNLWMPDLEPSPTGGFVLVASWGNPEANSFQVVMLTLDEGGATGEAWLMEPEGRDQTSPTLSRYGSTFDVLWSGKGASGAEGFWVKTWRWSDGAWSSDELIDLSARAWVSADVGRGVNLPYMESINPSLEAQMGPPYLIGSKQGGTIELINPAGVRGSVGPNMVISLGPSLGRGVIASYQRIRGNQSKVWWRAVLPEGSLQPLVYFEQDGPAAPYPLSLTPFPGGHLALWAQGDNPAFMLKATLLPSP